MVETVLYHCSNEIFYLTLELIIIKKINRIKTNRHGESPITLINRPI